MQVTSPSGTEQSNISNGPRGSLALSPVPVLAFLAIVAATLLCYSPVLFNFFNGDDFVHLTWLAQAIHNPEIVWRNFHTSWLDGTTTKFYRPLISVFMVSDYALWGVNGLGFRITNLMFHLSSTLFIYLIARKITDSSSKIHGAAVPGSAAVLAAPPPPQADSSGPSNDASVDLELLESKGNKGLSKLLWPLSAAALFALYPLHPEAVSWITGRVDSVVTAFCMGAVFFYICFSKNGKIRDLLLSLASATLGLLSKEMAITLPAVFVLYEIVYFRQSAGKNLFSIGSAVELVQRLVKKTICFWLLLAAYFVVRYFSLGTMVGGYDNSLLFIANMNEFLAGWKHALLMLLVPINKSLIGSHHILSKLSPAALVSSIVCAGLNFFVEKNNRRHALFLFGWIALCLAPVYKLFAIADDLQGSRLAYLATVPLCMLLTTGLLSNKSLRKFSSWKFISATSVCSLLVLSGVILFINNQPWKQAGEANNAIRASLQSLYKQLNGDPQVLFLGLPDQINGAYTCRNSLDGMTRTPQLDRDIRNCLMVNAFEPIFPFGYLKESIAENKNNLFVYRWDADKGKFQQVELSDRSGADSNWSGDALQKIVSIPEQKSSPKMSVDAQKQLHLLSSGNQPQFAEFDLGSRSCFYTDFIEMNVELASPAAANTGADLLYSNDMYPGFELKRRVHTHFVPGQTKQRLLFALRGLPEWSFGGLTHPFRLLPPRDTDIIIHSVAIVEPAKVMPALNFENSGYFGSKGYYHLQSSKPSIDPISIDASKVPGAQNCVVEITRTNLLFEEQNPQAYSKVAMLPQTLNGVKHEYLPDPIKFRSPGIYELRVFPVRSDATTICGAASDHIVISVDP